MRKYGRLYCLDKSIFFQCGQDKFSCSTHGNCIGMSKRCNGKTECSYDNSDEFGCTIFSHDDTYNAKYHPEDGNMSCQVSKGGIQNYIYLWPKSTYHIVESSNAHYLLGNQLFVKRSQYIRIENPLHKQSEKAYMCYYTRRVRTCDFTLIVKWYSVCLVMDF